MNSITRSFLYRVSMAGIIVLSLVSCSIFGLASSGPVALGTAGDFVILAKSEISTVPASAITGDVGLSPAATSFLHGFSESAATGYATSTQVTGKLYAADMADPTPIKLTTAVADMQTAYTNAAGRENPDFLNLSAGTIGGLTLTSGLYKWGSPVVLGSDVTLSGGYYDTWVFQVGGTLTVGPGVELVLSGGARPENIVWQVAGNTSLGAGSIFRGTILGQSQITMLNGATLTGRALAQTLVSLDQAIVTEP